MQDEMRNPGGEPLMDPTIGTPEEDVSTWDGKQNFSDTCTIRCQEFIIEQFTGEEVKENALVQEAEEKGFYTPGGGTSFEHTGSLLEEHGVPVTQYFDATPHDLANELAQGHKVILSVDADELWGKENPVLGEISGIADRDVNHDVVVSGIDTTDPANPQVIVSDPGTGEKAATYPLDQFVAAWQDSNFFMAATNDPVPPSAPEMVNFPYEEGHVPEVMGIPYEEFVEFNDNLEGFDQLLETRLETVGVDVPEDQNAADRTMMDQTLVNQNVDVPPGLGPVEPEPAEPRVNDLSFEPPGAADLGPLLPEVLHPNAPGPTLNPALLDPAAGPTLPPELLDPNTPGPLLPEVLDPNTPGPAAGPEPIDPAQQPDQAAQAGEGWIYYPGGPTPQGQYLPSNPWNATTTPPEANHWQGYPGVPDSLPDPQDHPQQLGGQQPDPSPTGLPPAGNDATNADPNTAGGGNVPSEDWLWSPLNPDSPAYAGNPGSPFYIETEPEHPVDLDPNTSEIDNY